jgi:hypothetical protein
VEVEGLWVFNGVINATPEGFPTSDHWQGEERVYHCVRTINATTGQLEHQTSSIITAAPPSP